MRAISPAVAWSLGEETAGEHLSLSGVQSLSVYAARWLAQRPGNLSLNGLRSLSLAVAVELSHHRGELALRGLQSLGDEEATWLSQHQGPIELNAEIDASDHAKRELQGVAVMVRKDR